MYAYTVCTNRSGFSGLAFPQFFFIIEREALKVIHHIPKTIFVKSVISYETT